MSLLTELVGLEKYTPAYVKSNLPLSWMVGRAWGIWDADEGMVCCPLPDHKDDTPSFNLWNYNDIGQPTKFGCFGCGVKGDVIDIIKILEDCDFSKALDRAVDFYIPEFESGDWELPPPRVVKRATMEDMKLEYEVFGEHDPLVLANYLYKRRIKQILSYVVDEWQWKCKKWPPLLATPHYDIDSELVGIRIRNAHNDQKWSIGGSNFTNLYGIWRDKGKPNVIICEGETDTVWSAYCLKERNCEVFGIVNASHQPNRTAISQLSGRRIYFLLDNDEAADRAVNTWSKALEGKADLFDKRFRMPRGLDVIQTDKPVDQILKLRRL